MMNYLQQGEQIWELVIQTSNDISIGPNFAHDMEGLLGAILKEMQRTGGYLYLPLRSISPQHHWVYHNIPAEHEDSLVNHKGELYHLAQDIVNKNVIAEPLPEIVAAAFPIIFHRKTIGALVVLGKPLVPDLIKFWGKALFHLGQRFNALQLEASLQEKERENTVLKYVARSQNAALDINDIQLSICKSIRNIFGAEEELLIVLDKDNPNLAIKKRLGPRNDWLSQVSLKLEEGLIWQSVFTKKHVEILDVSTNPLFNPEFDGVLGVSVQSILCIPLQVNGQILGALTLLNQPPYPLYPDQVDLLQAMTAALANSMFNMNMFHELKVSNADLEASRWELLHSRNTLRALFDSIPASIYIIDRKYNLLAINMSRSDRAKNPPNKLVGRRCYEKLYNRADPCPGCRAMETFNNTRITTRINRQWIDDEQFIEWEITTYPIQNDENYPVQVILLEQDVTEKRHLEANLIQSEKLAAVGQLAAGVAHEINNPLAAVIANAQLLLREIPKEDTDTIESLRMIEIAGTRASQVVKNLLGFARKEQFDFGHIDLNETIYNALSLVQHEVNSHPITIKLDLDNNLPRATASKDHLQGVWINLIMNAIDANDKEAGEIAITTLYQDNEFRILVTDNGKGISPEKLPRIFEPFYTTKAAGRGTGLGLSVCHRIIKQHGGTITAESKLNKGTKFTIILPASPNFKD
ncbi:MAG: hypothetical protein CVU39_09685 [Chloroflexi bacterium HGW-Chloroflexi-10]|nr:MAG: hypothetical protein CVU39_09685 [Chloroflexi bacterium HGW-Chloroflexi-10]